MSEDTKETKPKTSSLAELKARAVHKGVTLPSGAVVDIHLPNLPSLIQSGTIPNDLVTAALEQGAKPEGEPLTLEDLKATWDFTKYIVPKTLVSPEITEADVDDLSPADVEMLANFASRRIDLDAIGHQLGGLETQDAFRKFRDLDSLSALLGGV